MRRAGHKSAAAAMRYQHATSDRDAVLAAAFTQMAQVAPVIPISEGSRAIRGMEAKRSAGSPPLEAPARGNKWSGRPGSNRHDQLGRAASWTPMNYNGVLQQEAIHTPACNRERWRPRDIRGMNTVS
jgi:hypothetical protein